MKLGWALILLAACGGSDNTTSIDAPPPVVPDAPRADAPGPDAGTFASNCTVVAPAADDLLPAGKQPDGTAILPGGRAVTPTGDQVTVGGFPMALRLMP